MVIQQCSLIFENLMNIVFPNVHEKKPRGGGGGGGGEERVVEERASVLI